MFSLCYYPKHYTYIFISCSLNFGDTKIHMYTYHIILNQVHRQGKEKVEEINLSFIYFFIVVVKNSYVYKDDSN